MPIIAVVAAVVAVSEAVAVTATVFEIITAVGAVAGAIGAVTGNKTLMKIGAVVGIVGGIGALADSAGLFGAGADVAGGAAGATDGVMQMGTAENAGAIGAADAVGGGSGVVATPLATTPEPIGIPTDGVSGSTSLTGSEVSSAVTPGAPIATPTPAVTPDAPIATPTPAAALPDAGAIPSANASTAPVSTSPVPTNPMPTQFATTGSEESLMGNTMLGGHAAPPPPTTTSWFDTATDVFKGVAGFANANPNAAAMILQGISSAADPSARALREAQARESNSHAGYIEQETKNMNGVGGAIQWGLNPAALNQIKPPGNFRTGA